MMRVVKDELLLEIEGYEIHRLRYNNDMHFVYIAKDGKRIPIPKDFVFISAEDDFCDLDEHFREVLEVYPLSLRTHHNILYKGEVLMAFGRQMIHKVATYTSVLKKYGAKAHMVQGDDEEIHFNPKEKDDLISFISSYHENKDYKVSLDNVS